MRLVCSDSIWLCSVALDLGIVYYADHSRQRYYVQFPSANDAWAFLMLVHDVKPGLNIWTIIGVW